MHENDIEEKLVHVFQRVFQVRTVTGGESVASMEDWDSLTHIKLVMEVESAFNMMIDPDEIPDLFSDFAVILEYLKMTVRQTQSEL